MVPTILVDSREAPSESARTELKKKVMSKNDFRECAAGDHGPYFSKPISVGQFMGQRVKTIRVVRFAPIVLKPSPSAREIVRRVWTGTFNGATCYIDWAEGSGWSLEAEVEFEDGRHGGFISDGWHVMLQDHAGKTWFLRIDPPCLDDCR